MTLVLCAIFFISGASALVFENLWFRQAGLAFGNSVWASSLVLAGFMGGLAVGSWVAVWRGDRLGPPVRAYAVLELAIAVSGVALVWFLPAWGTLTIPVFKPVIDTPWILNPLRLVSAFAVLLVPSTAMGLTLPLLTKALVAADPNFGRVLGRLYGWNTLGAVAGTIVVETHLVRILGVHGSALVAGSLNLTAAASAAVLYRWVYTAAKWVGSAPIRQLRWGGSAVWLGAAFLSGFALLSLEVVWFRFLLLSVVGTSLSFAVMLAVVLAGISLGGLGAGLWLRRTPGAWRYAAVVSWGAGLLCVGSYILFPQFAASFTDRSIIGLIPVLRIALPLMFPVSLLSGVFFTFAGAALHQLYPSATAATGVLTLANTAGATLGAFAGGFLLLPGLGIEPSLFVMGLIYGAIGFLVLIRCPVPARLSYPVAGMLVVMLALFPWGTMFTRYVMATAGRVSGNRPWQIVGFREGLTETIIYIEELIFGKRQHLRLVTNSFSMSTTQFNARRYMKLFVYLPVAVHPDPESVLLISYGVGSTAKALTETESLKQIDIVDISRDIMEMSSIVFPDSAQNPLNDPRVRVHVEDGRYFLNTTEERFDLITGEPPPPAMAGVVNLYTREYFQLINDRLRDGGFVTYWLPLHSLSGTAARAVIRAFLEVFPDASLWHGWREDLMLVGSRNARGPVSVDQFERQWREPRVAAELKAVGLERPEQIGALFIGDADFLRESTRDVPPLVDDFPKRILSDSAMGRGSSTLFPTLTDTEAARRRFNESALIARMWPQEMIARTLTYFELQRVINDWISLLGHPLQKSSTDLHHVLTGTTLTAPVLWYMGSSSDAQRVLSSLDPAERDDPVVTYHEAVGMISERQFTESLEPLRRAEHNPDLFLAARTFRIYMFCLTGRHDEALRLASVTHPSAVDRTRVRGWWDFLRETCEVDVQ